MSDKKAQALICIASGSDDVDVIHSYSLLRELGFQVTLASAEGWSAVTLRCGLAVKPTCSLERAFYVCHQSVPYDLIIFPNGNDGSFRKLSEHTELGDFMKRLLSHPAYLNRPLQFPQLSVNQIYKPDVSLYIIVIGNSVELLTAWNVVSSLTKPTIEECIYKDLPNDLKVALVFSPAASDDHMSRPARMCAKIGEVALNQKQLSVSGVRESEDRLNTMSSLAMGFLSCCSNAIIPKSWNNYNDLVWGQVVRKGVYERSNKLYKLPFGVSSTTAIIGRVMFLAVDAICDMAKTAMRLNKSSIPGMQIAVLVNDGVDESLLATLVAGIRSKPGVSAHVIVCDRTVIKSGSPYITTKRFLFIRPDGYFETCKLRYDAVVTVDTDVKTYPWLKDVIHNTTSSCVTALFDTTSSGIPLPSVPVVHSPAACIRWLDRQKQGLCDEEMSKDDELCDHESKFFQLMWTDSDPHPEPHFLATHVFKNFHDCSCLMHVSASAAEEGERIAVAIVDRLRYNLLQRGYSFDRIYDESCNLL